MLGVLPIMTFADSTDDYKAVEKALDYSSAEVNKLNFPDLIYKLDEPTALKHFTKYFQTHLLTEALRINLSYPLFVWGDNHKALQKATLRSLADNLGNLFHRHADADKLEAVFAKEPRLHDHVFQSLALFGHTAMHSKVLRKDDLKSSHDDLMVLLKTSGLCEAGYTHRDPEKYVYLNPVLTQFLSVTYLFGNAAGDTGPLVDALRLNPVRSRLVKNTGVLVLDNDGFDQNQLRAIVDFLDAVPKQAGFPTMLRCQDLIASKKNKRVSVHMFSGGFNVFDAKVGKRPEQSFPDEWSKDTTTDLFTIVLAHEYTHGLDAQIPTRSPRLREFRDSLLKKAGKERGNYLRSTIEDGFFTATPQEFVPSIANEYCASSIATLAYALQKYDQGNVNQINQFVLMASLMSDDREATFFRIDAGGRVTSSRQPITKQDGVITSLTHGDTRYGFHFKDGIIDRVERETK
jgi:hypothetical protein